MALDDSLDAAASIGEDSQPTAPARSIADLQKAGYDLSDLAPAGSARTSLQPNPLADESTPNAPSAKPGWQTNLERAGYDFSGLVSAPPRPPAAPAKTPEPNWFSTAGQALVSGVRGGLTDVAHAPTAFTEHKPEEPDTSSTGKRLSEGISEGWSDPKWWIAHIAHGIGESSPSLATGAAGAYLGSMAGPVGTVVGGAGGFAVGSAIQTVAPAYQRAIADGLSHDDAVRRAIAETGVASAFGAVMGMGPGAVARVIEKPLARALAEIFVVQPGLGAAQQVSQGAVAGHIPTADELATGAAENIGIGGVLAGGHRVIAGRHVPPAAQEEAPPAPAPLPPLDLTDVAEPPLDLFNPLPPLPPPMRPLTRGERDALIHQQARSEQLGEQDRLNHQAEYDRLAAEREQQQTDANAARIAERQAAQQRQDLQQAGTTQAPVLPELDAARQRAEGEAAQDQAATGQAPAADISFTGETPADTRTSDVSRETPAAETPAVTPRPPQEPPGAEPEPPMPEPAPQPLAPAGGGAAARPQASGWTEIGKNYIGQTLYEDQRGVRSTIERGIRSTEPVGLRPSRDGMQLSVDRTDRPEYQIAEPHPANPRDVEYQPPTPVEPEAASPRAAIPFAPVENGQSNAFTYKGDAVPVEYGIVDARTLVTSNHDDLSPNPEFPQELQPRDRTRPETELQIHNLLNPTRFRPELLGPGPNAGSGTPIISSDGVVEGGNARSIALRRAYAQNLPVAETYRSWLASQGYPVNGIEQPVLVRMNRAPMDMAQREAFARDMNIPDQAAMSPSENASADARRITPDVLANYQGGSIDSAANRNFLRGILRSIVPENQYGAFIAPDGEITRPGLQRIQAALIATAYGDQGLVGKLVEDADNNIRAIGSGLLDAAPTWAQMRDAITTGRLSPEFDITNHLVNAVQLISHAREQGRNIAEFVQQRDMFGGALPAETEGVLQWMVGGQNFSRRFSRDKIGTALLDYAESAMRQARPALPGAARPNVQQLIEGARQRAQGAAGDLFDQKVGQPTGTSAVRSGIDTNRPEVQGPGPDQAGLDTSAAGAKTAAEAAGEQQPENVGAFKGSGLNAEEQALFDGLFGGSTAPEQPPTPAQTRSGTGERAPQQQSPAQESETGAAPVDWRKGFGALFEEREQFPSRRQIEGVETERYEQALPLFSAAVKDLGYKPGDDLRPVIAKLADELKKEGFTPERLAALRPYALQFMNDVKGGFVKLGSETAPEQVEPKSESTEPEKPPSVPIQEAWHAKKGAPVYVVKHPSSLDDAAYADLKKRATDLDGYWSSFKKQGAIPGWQFADRASAERFARMLGERESGAPPSAQHSNDPTIALSDRVADMLNRGETITPKSLHETAAEIFGGTLAEGKVSRDQLYDAMELGVNKYIRSFPDELSPRADLDRALENVRALEKLKNELPTQSVRAGEKDTHQQFSTPPDYAYAAAWIAHLRPEDRVLEPSAGTGSLAVHAMNAGAREVTVNELSNKRAPLVESLNPARAFRENAEQLHNILPEDVKPSVVLMNPPFSVAPDRMGSARVLVAGAAHITQALQRLEPGGRLVAIVGRGMTMDAPTFRNWWKDVANQYDVRANVGVDGKVYSKYGTTFDTRLLVIDKNPPSGTAPVTGDVKSIPELLERLEGTRNERVGAQRTAGEPLADQPGSEAVAGGSEGRPGAVAPVSPATGDTRAGTRSGDTGAGSGSKARSGTRSGADAEPASRPGQSDALVPEQPERPGAVGTEPGPAAPPGTSEDVAGSGAGGDGDVLRPDTGGESVLPPSGEPAGLTEQVPDEITRTQEAEAAPEGEITETVYEPYKPQRVTYEGAKEHPTPLVQSAAMATVLPPATDYAPKFTGSFVKSGALSTAQLEAVTYAGAAHSKMLPANEGETPSRGGFFIGDGTGVGKGKQIAGIILDNWNQGRKKAVWVSENSPLVNDARRDWSGVGQDEGKIFEVGKIKRDNPIDAKEGIAFVPYTTLASGAPKPTAAGVTKLSNGTKVNIPGQFVEGENPSTTFTGKISKHENEQNQDIYTVKIDNGKTARLNRQDIVVTDIPSSRLDQIVNWLGKDFDGVIAFDESHNLGNSVTQKGARGNKPPSQKALSGVELQQRLPNARVVYVSATGATEVNNLAYAERLGLWGLGTPFADKTDFISKISNGGIAAMELVARDMKAMGKYVARSLAFGGPDLPTHQQVEYDRIEHKLSPDQRQIYDKLAEGWQVTLNNFIAALEATQAIGNKQAKTATYSAFWGAHQRFFNQIITSMQMPSVLRAVENDIKEGRQAVLQLVNTNEASQTRALAKVERPEDLEDLDMTPRDQLIQMIDKSFPTQQHEEYVDPDGNTRYRPVVDSEGRPVQNREAVAMKERLLNEVGSIRVPDGPLEMLFNHFGPDKVAEVTGRTQRVVKRQDEQGQMRSVVEKRTAENANVAETTAFQNAQKPILVFSQAGGTGRSYHADIDTPSADKRRSHYLVQAGWRADTAIQGFGRTHRTNQASAPQFHLVTTDLQGQRRFISSIARRLAQLGALTKGERKTGDSGVFSASDNLESREAKNALLQLYTDMVEDHRNPANTPRVSIGLDDFTKQTGLRLLTPDGAMRDDPPPITQFLNRLLSLKIEPQNKLFGEFEQRLQDATARAAADGSLDSGVETVRADHIHKRDEKIVYTEPSSGAESKYVKMELQHRNYPTSYDDIVAGKGPTAGRSPEFFVQSKQTGNIYAVSKASNVTDAQGAVHEQYRLSDPLQYRYTTKDRIDGRNADQYWTRIDNAVQARDAWEKQVAALPEFSSHDLHLITGAVLPIWDRLGAGSTRIFRLQTDAGERMLGRVIPDGQVDQVLKNLGAEREAAQYKPQDVVERVMQGDRATLANGWTLAQRTVAGEPRIELTGPNFIHNNELQGANVYSERIDYRTRYFVPTGADAADSVRRLIERHPVTEIAQGRDSGLAEGRKKFGGPLPVQRDLSSEFETFAGERAAAGASQHEIARDFVVEQGKASAKGARHAGHEFLTVYDPIADRITHAVTSGLKNSVNVPSDVTRRAEEDPNAGLVYHHNHPEGRALSGSDLATALSNPGVDQIVAHGHDGSISVARLSPFMQKKLAGLSRKDRKLRLETYIDAATDTITDKLWPLIERHEAGKTGLTISRDDANAVHADIVNRALDSAGVIEYITSHDSVAPLGRPHTAYITREGTLATARILERDFNDYKGADTNGIADRSTRTVQPAEGLGRLSSADARNGAGQLNKVRDSNGRELPKTQRQVRQGEEAGRAQEGLREADPYNPERDKDYKRIIATDEHVDISQRAKTLTDKIKQEGWLRTQAYWQDGYAAVEQQEKAKNVANPGKLLPAATSPIAAFRLASHSASQVDFAINNGQIRFNRDTGAAEQIPGKKGLVQLLTPLKDRSQQAVRDFFLWKAVKRGDRLMKEGRENNIPPDVIARNLDLDRQYQMPDGSNLFHKVDAELRDWFKNLLDFGEATDIVNPKSRLLYENDDYLPFYRKLADDTISGPGGGAGGPNVRQPIKQLKGGESKINNPIDNIVTNAAAIIRRGMWNDAANRLADHLGGTDAMTVISRSARVDFGDPEVQKRLRDLGLDPAKMKENEKEAAKDLFGMRKRDDPKLLSFLRSGIPVHAEIHDDLLARAVASVGPTNMDFLTKILAGPARLLRSAVIFDPAFVMAHNIRQAIQAYSLHGVSPFASFAATLRQVRGADPVGLRLLAGGVMSGVYDVGVPKRVRQRILTPEYQNSLIDTPLKGIHFLKMLSEKAMKASDLGPRVAVYEKMLRQGATEAEALQHASDLLDFGKHGYGGAALFLAQTIPFANARWQGIARFGKGVLNKEERAGLFMRGALITAASLALWNINKDDPEYQRKEDWDKQYAWHIKLGPGLWFRLPKNWEIGGLFGTLPEILADYADNGSARQAQGAVTSLLTNIFKVDPWPAGIKPAVEAYFNKSMFTNRPIVNEAEQGLVPDLRYGPNTHPSIVAATQAYNSIAPSAVQMAPDMVQHLLNGYLAGWGGYIAGAADYLGDQADVLRERPTARITDYPIINRFVHEAPEAGNRILTDFYSMRQEIDEIGKSIKKARERGDREMMQSLISQHPEWSQGLQHQLDSAAKILSNRRGTLQRQRMNSKLDDDGQRKAIDDFNTWRDKFADTRLRPLLRRAEGLPLQ